MDRHRTSNASYACSNHVEGATYKKHILYYKQEESIMARTIESLQTRIHMLQQRDPIANQRIIKKLKRQIRAMEKK